MLNTRNQGFIITVLLGIVVALNLLKMAVQDSLFVNTLTYQDLLDQIREEREKNIVLKQEILEKTAYSHIQNEAKKDGFNTATYIYRW